MKFVIIQFSPAPCYFLPLRPQAQIFSSAPYSQTLSAYVITSTLNTAFHPPPHKRPSKILVLYIFLDSKSEDGRFWTKWQHKCLEFNVLLVSSFMELQIVTIIPKHHYYAFTTSPFKKFSTKDISIIQYQNFPTQLTYTFPL